MNNNLKLIIYAFLVFVSINFAFAGSCCLSSTSFLVLYSEDDTCDSNFYTASITPNGDSLCSYVEMKCSYNGQCVDLPTIYSNDGSSISYGGSCPTSTILGAAGSCSGSVSPSIVNSGSGSGENGGSTSIPNGGDQWTDSSSNPNNNQNSGGVVGQIPTGEQDPNSIIRDSCSDLAGQFGFFNNKLNCEQNQKCLYNPYYGGYFATKFIYNKQVLFPFTEFQYDLFEEYSCIDKLSIKQCSDYKLQESCDANIAYDYLKNITGLDLSNLELG